MRFELGKCYVHSTGAQMKIVGVADTTLYGIGLVAETPMGEYTIVGNTEEHAVNWTEISQETWMEIFEGERQQATIRGLIRRGQELRENDIATLLGISETEVRAKKAIDRAKQKIAAIKQVRALSDFGMTNSYIAALTGLDESSVRYILNNNQKVERGNI